MANTARIADGGRWWIAPAGAIVALAGIGGPVLALAAVDDRDGIGLTRNEAVTEALGGRTWLGALTNLTGGPLADVTVRIRFLDREGRPVGTPLSARAARVEPGAGLHLQARLPAAAAGLRIEVLRWTRDGRTVEFGPGAPLVFGAAHG